MKTFDNIEYSTILTFSIHFDFMPLDDTETERVFEEKLVANNCNVDFYYNTWICIDAPGCGINYDFSPIYIGNALC